ncbi:hypothetical protein ROU88_08135 [Macrococcus capreoli]
MMKIENMNSASLVLQNITESNSVLDMYEKLKSIKMIEDEQQKNNEYEKLINNLLTEKQMILSIAKIYKDEYERINITDEDLEHLQTTVRNIVNIFNDSHYIDDLDEKLINLIQKDTLKTMQLLGVNYKKAIGEPVTELVASKIRGLM